MEFEEIWNAYWDVLHSDIVPEDHFPERTPLLAHYTSLENLENILRSEQLWMSNPLNMNDLEEVRFGVNFGREQVLRHKRLSDALASEERRTVFYNEIVRFYDEYAKNDVLDLYVTCFSIHDENEVDGRLSMWRGYGNNGKGAIIVFDSSKVAGTEGSPFVIAPVEYASSEHRIEYLTKLIDRVADFIECTKIPTDRINAIANGLFQRICLFAVFSKHLGFSKEREWRLVYLKNRDIESRIAEHFSYNIGSNGIEAKLKLPIRPIDGALGSGFQFSSLVHSIIIGPSTNPMLTKHSIERMLVGLGKSELKERVKLSSIPFRAT